MLTATETQKAGMSLTQDSYFIFYGDHDRGCKGGFMVREGLERAEQSERLMRECGYRQTEVRHAISVSDGIAE